MSDAQRRQTWDDAWGIIIIIFVIIFVFDWLFYNGIVAPAYGGFTYMMAKTFFKVQNVLVLFRLLYVVSVCMFTWNMMSVKLSKKMNDDSRTFYRIMALVLTPLVIMGYHSGFWWYDLLLYPIIFIAHVFFTVRAINTLGKKLVGEDKLAGISQKDSDFKFVWDTDKGQLTVHSPQQHIWCEGGPGSGKSQSIIKPIIKQAAQEAICGVVYDFEGDPTEPDAPILGKIAYTATQEFQGNNPNFNFSFINFTDMGKTVRVNPLSRRYMTDKIYLDDLIENFMTNLKSKDEKQDFWSTYALTYMKGIAYLLWKNHPEYCTIPHMIAVALQDIDLLCNWIKQDQEAELIWKSIISAQEKKAEGQLAGVLASAQLPLSKLLNKEMFWVLSADEFDLDISRPDNAYLLCIGNSKKKQQALAPALAVVFGVILKQMNTPGRLPSIFCFDEFPTVRLNGIANFMATVRKHKCSVILGLQDFSQAEEHYQKQAGILRTTCGNLFVGMTNSNLTGKFLSEKFGKQDIVKTSYSTSQDSVSVSESLQKEDVMQLSDVTMQSIGHFSGSIAGGKPPIFSLQFDEFKYKEDFIPDFAYTYKTGNVEVDKEILEKQVDDNYKQILNDAENLINKYR